MTPACGPSDVERFRAIVAHRLGLHFEDGKHDFLADVLRRRFEANGAQCDAYLARLDTEPARAEWGALAQGLTVAETYFFRHLDQFRAFAETALPERMLARTAARQLRILSAGCASGEEAYTLAILVRETLTDPSWNISILGVDINPAMIQKAMQAHFSSWALRETPAEVQRRWFRPQGRDVVLDPAIRESVKFEERNLADDDPDLWQAEAYDVIFCRNVIMYFTPEGAQALVGRITSALAPGGYLFLGHAETLRGLSQDFHLRHTHGTFYYQRRERIESHAPPPLARFPFPEPLMTPLASLIEGTDTWVDAIRRASERIHVLTQSHQAEAMPGAAPITSKPRWDLGHVLELLRRERFAEALEAVEALPPESACDPDALLLQAVLLTHNGQLGKAEEACRLLLQLDELNAGAHYVLALCREGAGDRPGATDHDQAAVYLDPGFAMPRLHLGLLARRANDLESARRELGQALTLLEREDASRLLLFGGGFGREALVALCKAGLIACGGKP